MDNNDQPTTAMASGVSERLNLESMINRFVGDIEKLRAELKTKKAMLDDAFNNDPEYAAADEKVKEMTRAKTVIKQKILKEPAVELNDKEVKRVKEEIKDAQAGLSSYLQKYYQTAGTNQIVGEDGEVREIVIVTKLVKKSSKYNP